MAGILDHDLIAFMDFLEDLEENQQNVSRRYIRDRANPLERYTDEEFCKRFKFTKDTVVHGILPILNVQNAHNDRGLPIPILLQLLVALRFYATGDFQLVLGDLRGISQSTVSRIVKRISEDIARNIRTYIKFPDTAREVQEYQTKFHQIGGFPDVIGVIDCTHVPIKNPGGQFAELYRNRKSWASLNVQLICGPNMEILNIVSRWSGSTHDSKVFYNSAIKQKFEDGSIQGILLGNNSYPQLPYLFTPIFNRLVTSAAERRYNSAHKRTRKVIEKAKRVLKQRFQCLQRKLLTKMVTTQAVIVSCAVLHNIGVRMQDILDEGEGVDDPVVPVPVIKQNHPSGSIIRQQFIQKHFL